MRSSTARIFLTAALAASSTQLASAQCDVIDEGFTGFLGTAVNDLPDWTASNGPVIEFESTTTSEAIAMPATIATSATRALPTTLPDTFALKFDIKTEVDGLFQFDCPLSSPGEKRARVLFDRSGTSSVISLTTGASVPMAIGAMVPMEFQVTIDGIVTIFYNGAQLDQFSWSVGAAACDSVPSFSLFTFQQSSNGRIFVDNVCVETEVGNPYCVANPNTTGVPASLIGQGSVSITVNSLRLQTSNLPLNQLGYYIVAPAQGFIPNVGGGMGNLCISGAIGRYNNMVMNSGSTGVIEMDVDLLAPVPLPVPALITAGDTYNYQLWYRDWITGVGPTNNLSNGLELTFTN